jgi:anti-anti-sigma factor
VGPPGAGTLGLVVEADRQLRIVRLPRPHGLRLEGEIDLSNADLLARALARSSQEGPGVRLDLSRLDFIDVAGLRVLVAAAAGLSAADKSLTLTGVCPHLRKVLRVCAWDAIAGLKVAATGTGISSGTGAGPDPGS